MMVIVPESDELQIDARLPANEIDQVHKVKHPWSAFQPLIKRTTPELSRIVSHVSADVTRDPQSNANIYTVRSVCQEANSRALASSDLFQECRRGLHQTGSRTMMSTFQALQRSATPHVRER